MQTGCALAADEPVLLASIPDVTWPPPLSPARAGCPSARVGWLGVCASLVLHAVAAASLMRWIPDGMGAIQEETEAISIEVTLSSVVEQAEPVREPAEASAATSVADAPGTIAASEAIEEIAAKAAEEHIVARDVAMYDEDRIGDVIAGRADSPSPPDPAPHVEPEPRREDPDARRKEIGEPVIKPKRSWTKPASEGGSASRATVGDAQREARISASTGSVIAYAARIRARVAGNRPKGRGFGGRVVVAFGVTAGGGLAFVSVRRSSGNAAIDAAALQAVRRSSPFPPPPPGTPQSRLSFSVPFEFR